MDTYYIKTFISPILILIFFMILLKFCRKFCSCTRDTIEDEEGSIGPVYVIPVSANEVEDHGSDFNSVVSLDPYAPPGYDTLDPPPPYLEKLSIYNEAPPAYSQLEIPAGSAECYNSYLPSETQHTSLNEA